MKIIIYHLYPDLLDLYGDRGNVLALVARCRWRGLEAEVRNISLNTVPDFSEADIVVLGGGSDREQILLIEDLRPKAAELKAAVENGLVLLAICGGYQLLGQYYQTAQNQKIPGLGLLDFYTVAGEKRMTGNVIIQLEQEWQQQLGGIYPPSEAGNEFAVLSTLVGFENHSGRTYLGSGLKPLGTVLRGYGNNGQDSSEGVRYKNVIGTYLHGPILPKNPHLADLLLALALKRQGLAAALQPLDDRLEIAAHLAIRERFGPK
ncbi:MAG: glutamine amidotransferase [Peptococcaceae bacterium]|jgi:CobQ-like glutamine amidotransferase family enzyme|nr:glutamine amidotransferase [Peptococcaceae bacterium]